MAIIDEFHTKLAGVTKRNDDGKRIQALLEQLDSSGYDGMALWLEHEADNDFDANAVKVYAHSDHIGYLNRELATEIVDAVDEDRVEAELSEITGGEDGKSYGCNIRLRILDAPAPFTISKPEISAELVDAARGVVVTVPTISVSDLQRRLGVGYTQASALMDKLEEMGAVGSYNAGGKRDVLIYKPKLIDRIFKPVMTTLLVSILVMVALLFVIRSI